MVCGVMGVMNVQKAEYPDAENVTLLHKSCAKLPQMLQHPIHVKALLLSTKHHHMMRCLANAVAAIYFAKNLFTTVPLAILILTSNVHCCHLSLKLKFMTTN